MTTGNTMHRRIAYLIVALLCAAPCVAWYVHWLSVADLRRSIAAVNKLGGSTGHAQSPFLFLWDVETVEINRRDFDDDDLAALAPHLQKFEHLRILGLGETKVTGAGLRHIDSLSHLLGLYLYGTKVGDAGFEDIRGLTGLGDLSLAETQITDEALIHLKHLPRLGYVNLADTNITDDGLRHLEELPKLRRMNVARTGVTEQAVFALRRRFPSLHINHQLKRIKTSP